MKTGSRTGQTRHLKAGSHERQVLLIIVAVLSVLRMTPAAHAESNWNLSADAGFLVANTYLGSSEHYVTPVPEIRATRQSGSTTWFIGLPLDGFGVSHRNARSGLLTSLRANFGNRRRHDEYSVLGFSVEHDERTLARLAGTPDVTTPMVLEARLQYPTRLGVLETALGYHPINTTFEQKDREEINRHGFVLRLQYLLPVQVSNALTITGLTSLGLMDSSYAQGWFALDQETKALTRFEAGAGLRDYQAALHVNYRVSSEFSLTLYYSETILTGDAADSPYTVDRHQQTFLFRTAYSF
jgi:outer membrane scaffolding protein for murein synthesis (MipA/OmpV family)|nr:MipA/OmpV family protein [Candidatus Krumholzibacteria bacterium]